MPAEKELLNSTVATDFMNNDGIEFYIEARSASSDYWRVIPQRNLLQFYSHGVAVVSRQLEPRLMQLLCLLANADGSVLTRDLLMDALWPRVVVNENSLTRAVSELRKAFVLPEGSDIGSSDAAANSSLIETVPKRGYRLNADVLPEMPETMKVSLKSNPPPQPFPAPALSWTSFFRQSITRYPALRYPAIAAAMVISAALSSLWTLKLSDIQDPGQSAMMTQSGPESALHSVSATQRLEDRVLNEPPALPEGLHWVESVHNTADNLMGLQLSQITETVLAPGGQMMAFVEDFPGQSRLRLRSLAGQDDAWTVFTSSSPIKHLQWSPLDAGLLFTVEEKDGVANNMAIQDALVNDTVTSARLSRLMLLDLETLQVRELYRRTVPSDDELIGTVGSLT